MNSRGLATALAVLFALPLPLPLLAATHTVTVNADGSFSPNVVTINAGDTVEWRFASLTDAVVAASAPSCAAIKPYVPGDLTGPMPQAVAGVFTLGPNGSGFKVEPLRNVCSNGLQPNAVAGSEMLCRGGARGATMDATWKDPALTGVFIRLLWSDLQIAPGTADSSFDFTVLDRELNNAVKNGKVYSLAVKAGDDGTPAWLFANGVTALALQDTQDEPEVGCGTKMTLGSPTDLAFQNHYLDMLRKVAAHLKSRADWYRALAYIKPSGANLLTHENRLPKRCLPGCPCNPQIFAEHGYHPSLLYAFYQAQTNLLAAEFPEKTMAYALIQDGFPSVGETGAYETSNGTSSGGPLPAGSEQTQTILDNGQAAHGIRFAVQHNGLHPMISTNCASNRNGVGCPNRWVVQEGLEGQVTGFQTTNDTDVTNPAGVDSALLNEQTNSQGIFLELYEERYWEAVRQPNGVINPAGSGRTMAQWIAGMQTRRRALFASLPEPFPTSWSHTFPASGSYAYVHPAKCTGGTVVVLGTALHRRSVRH